MLTCFFMYKYWFSNNNKKKDYLKGIDIIYWINLERAINRKQEMETMLREPIFKTIKKQRIVAIDGLNDNIENEIKDSIIKTNNSSTNLEYACLLSHLNTIKRFSTTDKKIALILEDDMTLEYKQYWNKSIDTIIKNAPDGWDIIQLCYIIKSYIPRGEYTKNAKLFHSTGAYIINQKGAQKLMSKICNQNKYDLNIDISHNADIYLYEELNTYTYKYPYFIYKTDNNSYIHEEHVENIHNRSKQLIENNIYNI